MNTPKKFQPCPMWGIYDQRQIDEAIDWIFCELLNEPKKEKHDEE